MLGQDREGSVRIYRHYESAHGQGILRLTDDRSRIDESPSGEAIENECRYSQLIQFFGPYVFMSVHSAAAVDHDYTRKFCVARHWEAQFASDRRRRIPRFPRQNLYGGQQLLAPTLFDIFLLDFFAAG